MKKRGVIILLVVLTIITLNQISAENVNTTLEAIYNNAPPMLTQNIPNQSIAQNFNKINAFDLDNYFIDNETITYSVNVTVENITITIDANNQVSFYPDYGFTGVRYVVIRAFDGFASSLSNNFTVNVTNDSEPPQWSSPALIFAGTSIFQNMFINFTVDWTDNFGLDYFVFMINQGSGFASQAAQDMEGTQNKSRARVQISSSGGIVYWKVRAYDLVGNYNETAVQNFTVNTTPTANPGSGGGGGSGSGSGSTGSSSSSSSSSTITGYAPAPVSPTTNAVSDFSLSSEAFNIEVKQGSSMAVVLKVTNTGTQTLNFTVAIEGFEMFNMTVSPDIFGLASGESVTVNILFQAGTTLLPDIYYGKIKVAAGEIVKEVPVAVVVKPTQTDLELQIQVLKKYKEVKPQKPVIANITLTNIGDTQEKDFSLYYALLDFKGNVLDTRTEPFTLTQSSMTFEKQLTVPENAPQGEYIFFARVTSSNDVGLDSDTFIVGSRFSVLSFIRTNLLLLLIIIASIIVAILMVKHHRNQERLRLLNLYIMVTHLKKLLNEDDLESAIKLYIRIKATYGQPLSRSALQNKEDLKKEMEKLTEKLQNPSLIAEAEEKINQTMKEESAAKPTEKAAEEKSTEQKVEQKPAEKTVEEKPEEKQTEEKPEEKLSQKKKETETKKEKKIEKDQKKENKKDEK